MVFIGFIESRAKCPTNYYVVYGFQLYTFSFKTNIFLIVCVNFMSLVESTCSKYTNHTTPLKSYGLVYDARVCSLFPSLTYLHVFNIRDIMKQIYIYF